MLAEIVSVVGGIFIATFSDGGMAAEMNERADGRAIHRAGEENADVRIDRPGGADDVGMHLSRMRHLAAVAHFESAVEVNAFDLAGRVPDACVSLIASGVLNGFDDSVRNPRGICRIAH